MNVLFQARINLFTTPGGDTVQIVNTKEFLEKIGITVDLVIDVNQKINYNEYDIVHLFNVTRIQETYWYSKNAKRAGKPIILSTIYWDNTDVEKKSEIGLRLFLNKFLSLNTIEYLKTIARLFTQKEFNIATLQLLLKGFKRLQLETVKNTNYFLPNAEIEMAMFHKSFSPNKQLPYLVVPNAVNSNIFITTPNSEKNIFKYKDCILCVGRIDPRKNQLNLVRAFKNSNKKLVFIGQHAPNHKSYMNKILHEATENMFFLGWMDNENISEFYKLAKVHVCPSWYETPGLASLEAASFGCNIVITDLGSTREYFGDYAYYCEPDSIISIKSAVECAFNNPKSDILQNIVLNKYIWEETANKTLEAYNKVLTINKL